MPPESPTPAEGPPDTEISVGPFAWIALVAGVIVSVVLVIRVLWYSGHGYDFSDEGFYLNSIAFPRAYEATITQFGFIYQPLYEMVGGSISLLRQTNILITLGLAFMACFAVLGKLLPAASPTEPRRNLPRTALALVIATSSLAFLDPWLPTPNYNTLALQALMLAATGMVWAEAQATRRSMLGWVLISFSGWLAFMAKPSSALVLGLVVGLYLLATGKVRWRLGATALAVCGLLGVVSAWVIDGSIFRFIGRLVDGLDEAKLLQTGYSLSKSFRWDDFVLSATEKRLLAINTTLVFLSTGLCLSSQRILRLGGTSLSLIFSLLGVGIMGGLFPRDQSPAQFQGMQGWAIPMGALAAALVVSLRHYPFTVALDRLALGLSLATFPHIFAFGTGRNYWVQTPLAAIFWVMAAVVMLGSLPRLKITWLSLLPVAVAAQLCTLALVSIAMEYPYRQTQALRTQQDEMKIAGTGASLLVPRQFANYVGKIQKLAATNGFQPGEPILDLTGHYPGTIYALGARAVGRAWLIGDYKGSNAMAIAALDRLDRAELHRAWVLIEPNGPRKLSPDILKRYGIDLTKDYAVVGTIDSPTGSYSDSYQQILLKPTR